MGESEDVLCDGVLPPRDGRVKDYLVPERTRSCVAHMPINTNHLTKKDSAVLNWY